MRRYFTNRAKGVETLRKVRLPVHIKSVSYPAARVRLWKEVNWSLE